MKKYLLLRDNKESGPYSLEQLQSLDLLPLDLIWIEGRSNSWEYPSELAELKGLNIAEPPSPSAKKNTTKIIYVSFPERVHMYKKDPASVQMKEEDKMQDFYPELKERINDNNINKPLWVRSLFPAGNILSLATVFICLVAGSFIVKKVIDQFQNRDQTIQPVQNEVARIISQDDPNAKNKIHLIPDQLVPETNNIAKPVINKPVKPKDIKMQVRVKTNSYKVGIFGGINGLQLTVYNQSPHFVNQVIVAVDFLKPNGKIFRTDQYQFQSISARSSQTISVPASKRGVKIKYRIINIFSEQYKAALKNV